MIFVTVGTQDVPFDRLIRAVERELEKGTIKEEVIVQCGCTKVKSKKMKMVNLMEMEEFKRTIKNASVIISHGGVGTIIDSLNANKVVIVCPRLAKYKEHANDHQLQIVKKFSEDGYIIPLKDANKLAGALETAKIFKPKKYQSNTENMIKLIENFIDKN